MHARASSPSAVRPAAPRAARPGAPSRRLRDPLLPPQHGAWGFLGLPLVVGAVVAGWTPWLVPLAVAWIAAYPTSWALSGLLSARRPERFRRAALAWTPVTVVAGLPLLLTHPWLGWVLAAYTLLFAVNLAAARARRERSIGNDLVLVAECTGLVPVLAGLVATDGGGSRPPVAAMTAAPVLLAALVVALTLIGSTLHVKSLIRERRNPIYARVSILVGALTPLAVLGAAVEAGLGIVATAVVVAPFALLAVRARWGRRTDWRPGRLGIVELVCFVAVALSAVALR